MAGRKPKGNEKYHLESRFDELLKTEIEKRKVKGENVTLSDLYEELSNFLGISSGTILSIKKGINNPSLVMALKIAEYFNLRVEEIWYPKYNKEYKDDRKTCNMSKCDNKVFANDLCFRHYNLTKSEEHNKKRKGSI